MGRLCTIRPQGLNVNSPLQLRHINVQISDENLVLDQDDNFCLMDLSIFTTCLLLNL